MAAAMLGIMITKYEHPKHIAGIVRAARAAGRPVTVFLTDEGVRFTKDAAFLELLTLDGVEISSCDHSRERVGIEEKADGISYGTQYNNAAMLQDSARVLVF